MIPRVLLIAALGIPFGIGVGLTPWVERGPIVWGIVFAISGGFFGWAGWWILAQSNDMPKMKAALPLSGPVLSSVACLLLDEPFRVPVPAALILGFLSAAIIARMHRGS